MLKKTIFIAGVTAIAALAACDRVADISGTWSTQPEQSMALAQASATMQQASNRIVTQMTFNPSAQNATMGNVTFSSTINITDALTEGAGNISVAATASATGSYSVDDDKVYISIDNKTLKINVDPDAIEISTLSALEGIGAQTDSIAPTLAGRYVQQLSYAMPVYYAQFSVLDDIKIKNGLMKCEIHKTDQKGEQDILLTKNL